MEKFNQKTHTFTLSNAKTHLRLLTEKAMKGEAVYIVRGQNWFVLQHVADIDPIPMRSPGYFANCCTKAEIKVEKSAQQGFGHSRLKVLRRAHPDGTRKPRAVGRYLSIEHAL